MAAPKSFPLHLVVLILVVPLIWWALDHFGQLGRLNNIALDWLFQWRGEIPAVDRTKPGNPPLKVMYVDIDAPTVSAFGERPWPRGVYAFLMNAILADGHAKAVGLDFVLSPAGMNSVLVDKDKARETNHIMAQVMQRYPEAVISAVYSNDDFNAKNSFPYIYDKKTDPTQNGYPESPTFPLIGTNYGSVALVDVATQYSPDGTPDTVPRWIPLFAETEGPGHTRNLIKGILDDLQLKDEDVMHLDNAYIIANPKTLDTITLAESQKTTFYNLALELALNYLGLDHSSIHRSAEALTVVDKNGRTVLDIPLREQQLVEVNWFTKWKNPVLNPRRSAVVVRKQADYLANGTPEEKVKAAEFFTAFNDAIVLIGPVDPILQDLAPTPFDPDPVPKVSVYGNLLKTFFSGDYLRRPPEWVKIFLLFGLTIVVGGLGAYTGRWSTVAKFGAVVVLVGYVFAVLEAFARFTIVLPIIAPAGSAFATALASAVLRLVDEERQKRRIKGMFGTYISPELVHRMVESGEEPQLGGEQLTISIFFSDVQGFSGFSEVLTPHQLVELMNEYLTAMTDILQAESGTLDKYIGDAIVAMCGAPIHVHDNALRCCIAACRMQKRLGELRTKWVGEGDKWPPLVHKMRMRIGVNTGPAVVGNMGSTSRFNYTMMGDDVNLGARLESGAKQFGVYTMCSEATKTASDKIEASVLFRRLNRIKVKGRSTPVEVYEVVGLKADASPDALRCIEIYEQGLDLYFAQKWDAAMEKFTEAQKLEPLQPGREVGVEHNASELMLDFCAEMKANPPGANWDGVYEMTHK